MDGKRILLVEDELLPALDTGDVLTECGYTVVGPALSVSQALPLLDQPLDAAVLDVLLGSETVWPVADALQRRGVPFVLLTGMLSEMPPAYRSAPILGKPVHYEALRHAIRMLIGPAANPISDHAHAGADQPHVNPSRGKTPEISDG